MAILLPPGRLEEDADGYVKNVPPVVAEILSPTDTMVEVERKIQQLLDCGVQQLFLVNPNSRIRTVTVHRDDKAWKHRSGRVLVELPRQSFEFNVRDLWENI